MNFSISCAHLKKFIPRGHNIKLIQNRGIYCTLVPALYSVSFLLPHKLFSAFVDAVFALNPRYGKNWVPPCMGPQVPIYGDLEPAKLVIGSQ